MRHRLERYLRLLGFSVCTLAVAVCTRFAPAHAASAAPEPRISPPPEQAVLAASPTQLSDAHVIAELEARLASLSAKISNLSKALDVLGPLPDHADLFIPVALSELDEPSACAIADFEAPTLGARAATTPPPVDLAKLAGAGYHLPSHNIRLMGELGEDEAMKALCVELSALSGQARVVAPIRAW